MTDKLTNRKPNLGATPDTQRRSFLTTSAALTLAAILPATAKGAELCVDPEELSSTDYSFRKYVEYTESSPHKDKSCSGCNSFLPPAEGNCGRCRAVAGDINKNGYCTGWEANKPAK